MAICLPHLSLHTASISPLKLVQNTQRLPSVVAGFMSGIATFTSLSEDSMDPLSHAMVGAIAATSTRRARSALRIAALCGALAGMAPDLDILIRSADNPMLGLAYHRYFTHALIFAPLGAGVVAGALWLILRKRIHIALIYLFCLIGFGLHGILDAMTNYGTHLFWPFTDRRESWSIISVIDPIFTFTLMGLLIVSLWKKTQRYARIGGVFALVYLSVGYYQREQATAAMQALATTRSHTVERFEVKPSLGNLLAWRGQYAYKNRFYIDAFHVSPWRGVVVYEGGALTPYVARDPISKTQKEDLNYFIFFSDGWVAADKNHGGIIGDVRFSMLPHQTTPLWGIRLQPDKPEAHVLFENIRKRSPNDVAQLWRMIQGHSLDQDTHPSSAPSEKKAK